MFTLDDGLVHAQSAGTCAALYCAKRVQLGVKGDWNIPPVIEACLTGPCAQALALAHSMPYWNLRKLHRDRARVGVYALVLRSGNLSVRWQPFGCDFDSNIARFDFEGDDDTDWIRSPILGPQVMQRPDNELYFIEDFAGLMHRVDRAEELSPRERLLLDIECEALVALLKNLIGTLSWFVRPIWEDTIVCRWKPRPEDSGNKGLPAYLLPGQRHIAALEVRMRHELEANFFEGILSWALSQLKIEEGDFCSVLADIDPKEQSHHARSQRVSTAIKNMTGAGGPKRVARALGALKALNRLPKGWSEAVVPREDDPWETSIQQHFVDSISTAG